MSLILRGRCAAGVAMEEGDLKDAAVNHRPFMVGGLMVDGLPLMPEPYALFGCRQRINTSTHGEHSETFQLMETKTNAI